MNGEAYQLCSIVAATKRALKENTVFRYEKDCYVDSVVFHFLPIHNKKRRFFSKEKLSTEFNVTSVEQWYQHCIKLGLKDIKYLTPISTNDRAILGFANTNIGSIVCFFSSREVTYFDAYWEFNKEKNAWDVTYTEHLWENPPSGKPQFEDNSREFKEILNKIGDFACKIELPGWKKVYDKSIEILEGTFKEEEGERKISYPKLPEQHLKIFMAASNADVFGAMGSWNDSPPYAAHDKGLDKEYEEYSAELLRQVRKATLYAVNEW